MHDWTKEVRRNLKDLGLGPRQQEEIVAELATHLQDHYEQLRAQGMSEPDARTCALEQASGWRRMVRRIQRAKHEEGVMNYRTKALWLPGLVSLAAASILLMVLQHIPFLQPRIWWHDGGALVIHVAWFLLLPLCGAAGAHLSSRAGGKRLTCLAAGLFPAIVMLTVFCVILPVGVVVERNAFIIHHPEYFLLAVLNWSVIPGVALASGAALACGKSGVEAAGTGTQCSNVVATK